MARDASVKPSPGRILTTITGSLPRPAELVTLLDEAACGNPPDADLFRKVAASAVADAVRRQADAGIDVLSDGEMASISFMDTAGRLTGFTGPMAPYFPADLAGITVGFADMFARAGDRILASNTSRAITYLPDHITQVISRFTRALDTCARGRGAFLPTPSPGVLARLGTSAFDDHAEFLFAIAAAMREEYRRISAAGLQVQLDAPDLAMGKHTDYTSSSISEFREIARLHVEAVNVAVEGIPREQVRLHVCWGNYPGPHHYDLPLEDIIDILYGAHAGTLVVEQANPRHRHEWEVFRRHPLPDHMILAAGVIDTVSPHVEDPQVVADSLTRLAGVVGKEQLMAATDCGFATFASIPEAPPEVAYLKLAALAGGARRASELLWG